VHYQYLKYNTCSAPAKAEACTKANGTATECVNEASACAALGDSLTRSAYHFDGLGRMFGEFTKLPSGSWNQRLTEYDGMSRKTSLSEWQANGTAGSAIKKTQYRNFDPFGRVRLIVLPDEPNPTEQNPALLTRKIQLVYTGIRKIDRTVSVATSASTESPATTTEEYDRQTRLVKVTESSGSAGANVTTTYGYDVGNRLSGVSTTSGATTQTRSFTYDNRGFLTSEQLPEKGASGNGTVSYASYDARGHVGAVTDGPSGATISYCYDRAERTTLVASPSTSCATPVPTSKRKEFTYGTNNNGSDKRNGKLVTALRHNFIPVTDYPVTESYTYAGVGGRASARTTSVDGRSISQSFTWNDLGSLSWQQYPDDSAVADPTRKVINTYTLGFLTGVCEGTTPPTCTANYATTISYHPNLMVYQVVHANGSPGVTDTYAKDDNDMRRPKSVATTNTGNNWSTGTYQYDGSGNIWKIGGPEVFIYDKVNRLTSGTILAAGVTRTQTAAYDAFGNMTTTTTHYGTRAFTVSGTTNHVTNWSFSYDAAGNQLGWNDGSQTYTYTYTPLNEVLTYTTLGVNHTYLYTADGERVEDWDNTANTRTISVRDLSGKVLRLHTRNSSGTWSWAKDYVYRDGLQVASVESTGTKHFHLDHLGTIRRVTGTGTPVAVLASHDLYPFGLEATSITQDTERMKFTGHERDMHSSSTQNDDLDDMHARYYNMNVARFLSVDPGRDNNLKVPQAWNMYAYVRDNPLNTTDPSGRYACQGTSAQCQQIRVAVAGIAAAARALPKDSPGRSLLNTVSKFYGKPGQQNGVVISASPSPSGGAGGATTSNGTTTVFVDLKTEKTVANGFRISLRAEIAGTLTHEGQHGVDQRDLGMPLNRVDEFASEMRAYSTEAYVFQGQGVDAPLGLWTRATGLNLGLIRKAAEASTEMWCAAGGDCP
jgi:RHS repeat-associated protein